MLTNSQDFSLEIPADSESSTHDFDSQSPVSSHSVTSHIPSSQPISSSSNLAVQSSVRKYDYSHFINFSTGIPFNLRFEDYSSLSILCSAFSHSLKALRLMARKKLQNQPSINSWATLPLNFANSLLVLIYADQHKYFPDLFKILTSDKAPPYAVYHKFHIELDKCGFLRLKNYLPYTLLTNDVLSPFLRHPKSYLLRLIVLHTHERLCHPGIRHTCSFSETLLCCKVSSYCH